MKGSITFSINVLAVLLLIYFYPSEVAAQLGCTDPLALNFDTEATENDGSCFYAPTESTPDLLYNLPPALTESSGMLWSKESLLLHNDSGNAAQLFWLDTINGQIQQTLQISGLQNIDWEDLAQDESFIYVGDFGNNIGNRTDLRVLKIAKNILNIDSVDAQLIEFAYEDQIDFSPKPYAHNFDCEAMIAVGDDLHLFTKNWQDQKTSHYRLSKNPGKQVAYKMDSFDAEGLVSAADISPQGNIVLLGYTDVGQTFMWLLFDYEEEQFFSGNKRRIALGSFLNTSQAEGICFLNDYQGYICAEAIDVSSTITLPPRLLSFSIESWVNPIVNDITNIVNATNFELSSYPNPCDSFTQVHIPTVFNAWQVLNTEGQIVESGKPTGADTLYLDTSNWHTGLYIFELKRGSENYTMKIYKK